jgi:hypothetical protein
MKLQIEELEELVSAITALVEDPDVMDSELRDELRNLVYGDDGDE